jgi:hypothetical protein
MKKNIYSLYTVMTKEEEILIFSLISEIIPSSHSILQQKQKNMFETTILKYLEKIKREDC